MKKCMAGLLSAVMVLEMTAAPISNTVTKMTEHKNQDGMATEQSSVVMATEQIPAVMATETNYVVRSTEQRAQTIETQVLSTGDLSYEEFRGKLSLIATTNNETKKWEGASSRTISLLSSFAVEESYVICEQCNGYHDDVFYPEFKAFSPYSIAITNTESYGFDGDEVSEREFSIDLGSTTVADAQLVAQGQNVNIWVVEETEYSNSYNSTNVGSFVLDDVTTTTGDYTYKNDEAYELAQNLDRIYQDVVGNTAPHAGVVISTNYGNCPEVGDINNDSRVNVLLYDIHENGVNGIVSSYGYTGGYFSSGDFSTDVPNKESGYLLPIDVVHMDIGYNGGFDVDTQSISDAFYGTFAHELQHLIYYMYFGLYQDSASASARTYSWINESLSGVTDIHYGDPDNTYL